MASKKNPYTQTPSLDGLIPYLWCFGAFCLILIASPFLVYYWFIRRRRQRNLAIFIRLAKARRDSRCPKCKRVAEWPVVGECGHVFCWECIFGVFVREKDSNSSVPCCECGASILHLAPLLWRQQNARGREERIRKEELTLYNTTCSKETPFSDQIHDAISVTIHVLSNKEPQLHPRAIAAHWLLLVKAFARSAGGIFIISNTILISLSLFYYHFY